MWRRPGQNYQMHNKNGLNNFVLLGTDYTDFTVFRMTDKQNDSVNPCNPCLNLLYKRIMRTYL
jgi:hypothetical protein